MTEEKEIANNEENIVKKTEIGSSEAVTASQDYNSRNHLIESTDLIKKGGEGKKEPAAREVWGKKLDFILSVAGGFIGLGNIWRFPYLCYRNGGGAFLIPYFIFLILAGVPIFYLEIGLGQFTSEGGITAWERIAPITSGIGYGSIALTIILNMYYIVVLAWAIYYMWYSFYPELPWMKCGEWASNCCILDGQPKPEGLCIRNDQWNADGSNATAEWTSPSQEFWENKVLRVTDGVEDLGSLNWGMVLCLIISWIISYFCVWKGVKQTGKVVYFTATFPLVMLMVLLIRGITLPNAWQGVYYYMVPDLDKMKNPNVWVEAGTQIFFSYALCKGQLISLGSYNKYNTNIYKDVWLLSAFNSGTSFISGFAIFSILGYMAGERNMNIEEVAESGPGLAFIAYPRAVALLPCPQLWAILFFFMILLLGLDSQFVGLEAIITAVTDMYPQYRKGMKRQYLLFTIVGVSFSVGLTMCLDGGIYIFTLFDYYGASGICLLWLCLCECLAVGWVYGKRIT